MLAARDESSTPPESSDRDHFSKRRSVTSSQIAGAATSGAVALDLVRRRLPTISIHRGCRSGHDRGRRLRARCGRSTARSAGVLDRAARPRLAGRHGDRETIDVRIGHLGLEHPRVVQPREVVDQIGGTQRLAVVPRLEVDLDLRNAIRTDDGPRDGGGGCVDAREVATDPRRTLDVLFLI